MSEFVLRGRKVVQAGADRDSTDDLRTACERSLYVMCKGVLGMSRFTTHLHKPLCAWLTTVPPRRRILLMPRSTYKTTMAIGLGIWATIQPPYRNLLFPGRDGRNVRILFAAENEKRAISRLGRIRRVYMRNQLFRALWPDHVWPPGEVEAEVWTTSRFALPRSEDYPEATFEAAGVDSGSTGGHFDITVKDDLIGKRSRQQPELMRATNEWWDSSHSYFDEEEVSLDYVFGTRWSAEDLYAHIFEIETEYDIRIYSAIDRPLDLPPSGDPDKKLLFPEGLSRIRLEEMRRKYGELYYLNYENAPFKGGNTAFNMGLCGFFERDGLTLNYNEIELTARTLEIIEGGNVIERRHEKPKPFFRMTPEERTEAWLKMQENWHRDRLRRIELA